MNTDDVKVLTSEYVKLLEKLNGLSVDKRKVEFNSFIYNRVMQCKVFVERSKGLNISDIEFALAQYESGIRGAFINLIKDAKDEVARKIIEADEDATMNEIGKLRPRPPSCDELIMGFKGERRVTRIIEMAYESMFCDKWRWKIIFIEYKSGEFYKMQEKIIGEFYEWCEELKNNFIQL